MRKYLTFKDISGPLPRAEEIKAARAAVRQLFSAEYLRRMSHSAYRHHLVTEIIRERKSR